MCLEKHGKGLDLQVEESRRCFDIIQSFLWGTPPLAKNCTPATLNRRQEDDLSCRTVKKSPLKLIIISLT